MQAIIETGFDTVYLVTVITLGIVMIRKVNGNKQYLLFGVMAVVLGVGDAFHLVPRSAALCTTGLDSYAAPLGIGKLITSMTMTIFYILLYYVWRYRYKVVGNEKTTFFVWFLALARMVLCVFPQNEWLNPHQPLSWSLYRNIPFTILGVLIIVLFYRSAKERLDHPFRFMWLTIVLSFAFYLPVVLFADRIPLIGMLMIPKTCAYVWTIIIGYQAMMKEIK